MEISTHGENRSGFSMIRSQVTGSERAREPRSHHHEEVQGDRVRLIYFEKWLDGPFFFAPLSSKLKGTGDCTPPNPYLYGLISSRRLDSPIPMNIPRSAASSVPLAYKTSFVAPDGEVGLDNMPDAKEWRARGIPQAARKVNCTTHQQVPEVGKLFGDHSEVPLRVMGTDKCQT